MNLTGRHSLSSTFRRFLRSGAVIIAVAGPLAGASASENVPYRPFATRADVPAKGQLVVGLVYEESEAYDIRAGRKLRDITWEKGGEDYGIDINQGFVTLEYGLTEKWALDLSVGMTSMGSRSFSGGSIDSTTGLMDTSLGARYQIFLEGDAPRDWLPTLTFRAGAVLPGTFDDDIPFAPGLRSAAIEPEFLLRKHLGWTGFGVYGDALFRWNRTSHNDQYIVAAGVFQQIKRWEIAAGYRHMQSLSGRGIQYDPASPEDIVYPRAVREIYDAIEAGFSYTTSKRQVRWAFHTRAIVDGTNTDQKFWLGGSISMPFNLGGPGKN